MSARMPIDFTFARQVALPAQSSITNAYKAVNLADAFSIRLPPDASTDPDVLARFIFDNQPAWIGRLMRVRDAIVAGFGLKTGSHLAGLAQGAKAERLGIFKIYRSTPNEIVVGEDDNHLDFRVSILCHGAQAGGGERELTISTVVHCHNLLGRAYILVIALFHRMVVKASLRRAARIGWPP
ncbi:DUF2867 domain-containing protein [Massilia endophytica]|uniref:DUF2867 domain-containing protein n=1 Tax=Massilia endophytica TaxID=2899220 RepID=UPI001E592674|nr:DUF2867 domain-containing protein [Massilia endophytica]UGQ49114.1 DUF2867 domain-containing protein [Massilia endophytica]